MNPEISKYNECGTENEQYICNQLATLIQIHLPASESKIWHKHPVWFLEGNPVVGYSKLKSRIKLFFWSGKSFDEPLLEFSKGKFQDASILYTEFSQINIEDVTRWIRKSCEIQWDYKNLVKRKGVLLRLK